MAHRLRPIVSFVLIGIVLVFAVQNVADVEVQFLIWSFALPRAILIVVVFALGMLIGWILHSLRARKRPAATTADALRPPGAADG
jgi:uncharacterized integral membrane protein